jgi:hypothetical protein
MKISPLVLIFVLAACGNGDTGNGNGGGSLQDDGPLLCPDTYTTGRGNVWRGHDPYDLEERDLPCLEGDGRLHGYYIGSIEVDPGGEAYSDDNRFLYTTDDPGLNEVQAYYVITHQSNWFVGYLSPIEDYDITIQRLRSDQVTLDYNREEVQSYQHCRDLTQGMQGLDTTLLNVDVFAHEFGHHVLYALNRNISNGMIHEAMADYLAASFTQDSTIEPSGWSGFDRDLDNDHKAPDDIITRGEYCVILLERMQADGMDSVYPDLVQTFTVCEGSHMHEHHWASMILSGALWELRKQIGEADLNPALFHALHTNDIDDTGDFMNRLIESDAQFNQGNNEQSIRDEFTRRGIDQNLGLNLKLLDFSGC